MTDQERPTARDLAGSAVDLHGYAVLFKQLAQQADKDGYVKVSASRLAHISDFMEKVTDELLTLIPPEPTDDVANR
jgi:hypothetical protein